MKRILGTAAVLLLAASAHTAFAAGTLQSPDPVYFAIGIVMSAAAIGIYTRSKWEERRAQASEHNQEKDEVQAQVA